MAPLLGISLAGAVASPWSHTSGGPIERPETPARRIRRLLDETALRYPRALRDEQIRDVDRVAFQLARIYRPGASVADLGGGSGLLAAGCALLGLETWSVTPLSSSTQTSEDQEAVDLQRRLGVRVLEGDVRQFGAAFEEASLDVVSCIDGIVRWHHSARPVLAEAFRVLKPGGRLLLGAPNGVSLGRRIGVATGRHPGSQFEDWFYPDAFRGPLRAPVRRDLLRMVREIGFETHAVWGRTWAGPRAGRIAKVAASVADLLLRPLPTLASELYLEAAKPV
jgi:SAM-dependent methyltransferase